MADLITANGPVFSAVSGSARQLFLLLRCIGFASKAEIQLTKDGLRFAVEEARVMQGLAFLDKALFTSFSYRSPDAEPRSNIPSATTANPNQDTDPAPTLFQISLPALLETLQILGLDSSKDRWSRTGGDTSNNNPYSSTTTSFGSRGPAAGAFDRRYLGMSGLCRLSYAGPGSPFSIVLEESGVTTTCELATYEPDLRDEIPLQRDRLAQKIIMRSAWLHDAVAELASINPTRLTVAASPPSGPPPHFTLSATGPLGSAAIEFRRDPALLETFQVARRCVNTYRFAAVKNAARAMALASKVSIRGDEQGVLSLQFMIEVENGGISFVDFRFVPYVPEEGEDDEDEEEEEGDEEMELGL